MKISKKIFLAYIFSVLFVFSSCGKKENDKKSNLKISTSEISTLESKTSGSPADSAIKEILNENIITEKKLTLFAENDNETAFSLLQKNAEIDFEKYDFGVFVKSINGLAGNSEYFWKFFVNDEESMVGADQANLKTGDKVDWIYEKIES